MHDMAKEYIIHTWKHNIKVYVLMIKNVISHHVAVKCDIFRPKNVIFKGVLDIVFNFVKLDCYAYSRSSLI